MQETSGREEDREKGPDGTPRGASNRSAESEPGGETARDEAGGGTKDFGKPPYFSGWERGVRVSDVLEPEKEEETVREARRNSRTLETAKGSIVVKNYCPADELERLELDDGIFVFSRHNPERQKKALENVSNAETGNVIVGIHEGRIVSYIGVHHPSKLERWGKPGYHWLYELGAMEASRNYRRLGLADSMLHVAFDDPFYDDKVVLTTGFTWHWDIEGTGMDKMQYHAVGVELLGRHGFMEMATDEPNVTMDPANLFMVRLGRDVPFSRYQKFASLLFTNDWEAMLRGF